MTDDIDDLLDRYESTEAGRAWQRKVLPEGINKAIQEAPDSRLIQIRVTTQFRGNLYRCANLDGMTLSEWVRRVLEEAMHSRHGIKPPQQKLSWGDVSRFKK